MYIKKEGRKHPVVASVLLSIKLPVIFWDSPPHHTPLNLCSFSSLYHVDLFFFGWNMLQRLMILFRHILNYLCLYYGVAVWRESEGRRKKKCLHENQELHFKMLVFIALVSWTFACGYTNVVFYMCLLYDDDDDQLVSLTFKWRHEFLPIFFISKQQRHFDNLWLFFMVLSELSLPT